MSRTLIVGDVHGCFQELLDLLDRAAFTTADTLWCIGDLVDRGPLPAQVVGFFRSTPNAHSLRGNRDDKHIQAFYGRAAYQGARALTRHQFGDAQAYADAVAYFETLPLWHDLPEALLVHAMAEPHLPLAQQRHDVLLGHESGEDYMQQRRLWPWEDHYVGDKPLVVGHRDLTGTMDVYTRRDGGVIGIDTRCVYGGSLTALVLPNWTRVVVPARRDYWATLSARYAALLNAPDLNA